MPLWLPSQIKSRVPFDLRLAEVEWTLRIAQAYESLDKLRLNLQMRAHLFKFKDRFVRGQNANTRARGAIETIQNRVDACGEDYRAAYAALVSLSALLGKVGWQDKLLPLAESDKRGVSEGQEGASEGRKKISWIWKTLGTPGVADNESLRDGKW